MDASENDEVPMLSQKNEHVGSNTRKLSTRTRSTSMSAPRSPLETYESENNFTGPLRSGKKPACIQMSGPLQISHRHENLFRPSHNETTHITIEPATDIYSSLKGLGQIGWTENHGTVNEHLLRSGPLGMCSDPYCTTCPLYYNGNRQQNRAKYSLSDSKFHNVLYGDAKGWARRMYSYLLPYISGVMNPHTEVVQQWNKFFVISCLFAIFLDPLFFFLLSVQKENKCIVINMPFTTTLVSLRTLTDLIYLINMLLQFRLAYVNPESRVVGTGELVDHPKKIALNYLKGYFTIDFFVVLPLPQIVILVVIPSFVGSSGANNAKNLLRAAVLIQYIPRLYRFLPFVIGQSPSGFIFESAWANFVINLLTFVLSGHVVGSLWYLLGLQFRLAYVNPESRVVGTGELVDHPKKIALNYLKGYFTIDFFVVLPLPQIVILVVIPSFVGSSGANNAKNLLRAAVLIQYIPRLYRFLPFVIGQSPSGFIFESAWANFVINLLTFVLSGHVVGSLWYLLGLQFRLAYVNPESRVVGTGELVDHPKKIALNYLKGYFTIDFFVVLPLPQIVILVVIPSFVGSSGANNAKNLLRAAVLIQYIPRLYRFLPFVIGQSPSGFIFESAWANFVINLLTFVLSGHVVGSLWYLLGLQFRLAYVNPESRVVGTGELVDHPKKIALNYLKGYFTIDFFVVLPLPQIVILVVIPSFVGSSGANNAKNLLRAAVLIQYIPRLYRFLPFVIGQSPSGFIFESAWANFVINLLTFVLSGHVVGSLWYLLGLQFRLAYVNPESRVVGTGELVDHPKKIALNYLKGYFTIDFFVVLPLPQIVILVVIPSFVGSSGANNAKNLLRAAVLIQYIPRLYRFLPFVIGQSPSGFIFESAWANFVINLLTFVLSGHVVGSLWYLLGLQRVHLCLRNACRDSGYYMNCTMFIDCGHGNNIQRYRSFPIWGNWTHNENATACFDQEKFPYGIYAQAVNLTTEDSIATRYIYALFWGFQQISTLAGNQVPSYFIWEVLFTMAIIGLGLLLFALLIGNMQNFLQALGRRRLEMSLRRRDVEQWMSHRRLPEDLRRAFSPGTKSRSDYDGKTQEDAVVIQNMQVRQAERYNWAATRGVNEEFLLEKLPEDLQIEIRRHLFNSIKKVHIFAMMDEPILDAICAKLRQRTYIKGSRILNRGGMIEKMVFIVRGKMESMGGDNIKVPLSEGNVCGEELLTWCLEHSSVNKDGKKVRLPGPKLLSNRTVMCFTNVEAFTLQAADLEEVTSLFSRFLRNPRVQGALRYDSPYWRCLAANRIQVAWRYRKKRIQRAETSINNHENGTLL